MVSSNEASAISYDLSRISDDNENNIEQKTKKDLSQKYILKVPKIRKQSQWQSQLQ